MLIVCAFSVFYPLREQWQRRSVTKPLGDGVYIISTFPEAFRRTTASTWNTQTKGQLIGFEWIIGVKMLFHTLRCLMTFHYWHFQWIVFVCCDQAAFKFFVLVFNNYLSYAAVQTFMCYFLVHVFDVIIWLFVLVLLYSFLDILWRPTETSLLPLFQWFSSGFMADISSVIVRRQEPGDMDFV